MQGLPMLKRDMQQQTPHDQTGRLNSPASSVLRHFEARLEASSILGGARVPA